jgi:hypothetical protein
VWGQENRAADWDVDGGAEGGASCAGAEQTRGGADEREEEPVEQMDESLLPGLQPSGCGTVLRLARPASRLLARVASESVFWRVSRLQQRGVGNVRVNVEAVM